MLKKVVLACCALHNNLRSKTCFRLMYSPPGTFDEEKRNTGIFSDGSWREQGPVTFRGITPQSDNRTAADARDIRDEFCDYFTTNGQVPWQWEMI